MITIVIPAYNEEGAIGLTIDRLREVLAAYKELKDPEIIVVNHGSNHKTVEEAAGRKVHVINNIHNAGRDCSVKHGIAQASVTYFFGLKTSLAAIIVFTMCFIALPLKQIMQK